MKKVFLDANILIDFIACRTFSEAEVLKFLKKYPLKNLYISALSVHIVFYVLKIKPEDLLFQKVSFLINHLNIIPLNEIVINRAMHNNFIDFEDSIQYLSAISCCEVIFTRDFKDFVKMKEIIPSEVNVISKIKDLI